MTYYLLFQVFYNSNRRLTFGITFLRVVEETKKMKIGDPLDRSTQHGPQNHLAHLNKLIEYCETAEKEVRFNS